MKRFLLRRFFSAILTIWFITTVTFFAMHLVPGDPLSQDKAVSDLIRTELLNRYGLDKPLLHQYGIYMSNLVQGDLGISYVQENRRVNDIIRHHFPVSAVLGLVALCIAVFGAIILGQVASRYQGKWPDIMVSILVVILVSVPSFVLAGLAQWLLIIINEFFETPMLPVAGWGSLNHIWVPSLVLGLGTLAYLSKLMRASLLEISQAEYMALAEVKGLSTYRIFIHYRLRNAILPVLSVLGPTIATITTGGFVVELVFAVPGLGRYFVQAVQQLDYTVIMGTTVFYSAFLVMIVTVVDVLYGICDPRIRLTDND